MPHVLIAGITESGKTTLAKQLVARYNRNGIGTLVLDPLHDPGWNATFQTSDPNLFRENVKQSRSCALFIDESGQMIGRYNDEMFFLATRARHYGHNSHFITQRVIQLNKTVRDQCVDLFLFMVSRTDAKLLADEFNKPILQQANELSQFECFYCGRYGPVRKIQVTLDRGM